MGKVIMFDIPEGFRQESVKWAPPDQPGKIIEFRVSGTSLTHRGALTPELLSELTFCFAVNVLHGDPTDQLEHPLLAAGFHEEEAFILCGQVPSQ